MRQVHLTTGNTHLTCWVDKNVKVGDKLTLKVDPELLWDVLWVSEKHDSLPDKTWKVGGLK